MMALSDLFSRRRKDDPEADGGAANAPSHPTKALKKFLATLGSHPQPTLLDIGPVVGHNVTFFGEHLGCKFQVEELSKDIDRHSREDKLAELPEFLSKRFTQADETFDGILCWDLFDYLDKKSAPILARHLTRMLKPEGVLLAIFNASEPKPGTATYTKNIVIDPVTLKQRSYPATRGRLRPMLNRDIIRMFEGLKVAESFLLKNNVREFLFRKPASAD